MDPHYLLIVWTIAAIVLIGIASAIVPRRRPVFAALIWALGRLLGDRVAAAALGSTVNALNPIDGQLSTEGAAVSSCLHAAIMMRTGTAATAWVTSVSVMFLSNSNWSVTASKKRSCHSGGSPVEPCCTSTSCSSDKANGRGLVIPVGTGWAIMNWAPTITGNGLGRFPVPPGRLCVPIAA
jgi:hypothetical protein